MRPLFVVAHAVFGDDGAEAIAEAHKREDEIELAPFEAQVV